MRRISEKAKEKAKNVKLFAHDIHGVLTPNTFMVDIEGKRRYTFWHMDGFGDLSLHMNGVSLSTWIPPRSTTRVSTAPRS